MNLPSKCILVIVSLSLSLVLSTHAQDIILKPKHKALYAIYKSDYVALEYFIIDKPIGYVSLDTLIQINDTTFKGSKAILKKNKDSYFLSFKDENVEYNDLVLKPVSNREAKRRIERHNTYLYNLNANAVQKFRNKLLLEGKKDIVESLDKEWNSLFKNVRTLEIVDYKDIINSLVTKYGIPMMEY
jgi:hypothetical protein